MRPQTGSLSDMMSVLLRRVEHWHVGTREEGIWGHTGRRRLQLSWQRASGKGRLDLQTSIAYASSLVTAYWRGEHTLSRCVYTHFRTYKEGMMLKRQKWPGDRLVGTFWSGGGEPDMTEAEERFHKLQGAKASTCSVVAPVPTVAHT